MLLEIYGVERKKNISLKVQIFFFFSEVLSMWNQITNKNTDNSQQHNECKFENTCRIK